MNKAKIQPCLDRACGVHGRGAAGAREVICARQILRAYDRPGAIALLEQQPVESCEFGEQRNVLPLSSASPESYGLIQPRQNCTIVAHANPQPPRQNVGRRVRSFRPERLFLSAAGTAGGAADWVVNDVVLDGRSQLAPHRNLPGEIFGALGTLRTFDRISGEAPVQVTVTYVGSNSLGVPFFASLVGVATYDRRSIKLGGGRLVAGEVRELTARAEQSMDVFRVAVGGPTERVVVHDIRFGGTSQFKQPGDIPGYLFAPEAGGGSLTFKPIEAGDDVVVIIKCREDVDEEPIEVSILGQEPESFLRDCPPAST